jgi:hypothetical protein
MKLDKLEERRRETVDKLRHHVESVQADLSCGWKCKGSANQTECEALVLGHLIKAVAECRLNEDETWNQSLWSICSLLKGIVDLNFPGYSAYPAHTDCSWVPELHRIVDQALTAVEGLKLSEFPSSGRTARSVNLWSA